MLKEIREFVLIVALITLTIVGVLAIKELTKSGKSAFDTLHSSFRNFNSISTE